MAYPTPGMLMVISSTMAREPAPANHANHLSSVVHGDGSYTFVYNCLGDRLQQTVKGVSTNYTLDLNTGLTQALSDDVNAYLYSAGRMIALMSKKCSSISV